MVTEENTGKADCRESEPPIGGDRLQSTEFRQKETPARHCSAGAETEKSERGFRKNVLWNRQPEKNKQSWKGFRQQMPAEQPAVGSSEAAAD